MTSSISTKMVMSLIFLTKYVKRNGNGKGCSRAKPNSGPMGAALFQKRKFSVTFTLGTKANFTDYNRPYAAKRQFSVHSLPQWGIPARRNGPGLGLRP